MADRVPRGRRMAVVEAERCRIALRDQPEVSAAEADRRAALVVEAVADLLAAVVADDLLVAVAEVTSPQEEAAATAATHMDVTNTNSCRQQTPLSGAAF